MPKYHNMIILRPDTCLILHNKNPLECRQKSEILVEFHGRIGYDFKNLQVLVGVKQWTAAPADHLNDYVLKQQFKKNCCAADHFGPADHSQKRVGNVLSTLIFNLADHQRTNDKDTQWMTLVDSCF